MDPSLGPAANPDAVSDPTRPHGAFSARAERLVGGRVASCAWYIRARRGQRINLTLFNFIAPPLLLAPSGDSTTKLAADTCYHVGVVRIV